MIPASPYMVTASLAVTAQAVYSVRWMIRKIRRDAKRQQVDSVTRKFVADMATNHLPHIYRTESLLGEGINRLLRNEDLEEVTLEGHPPIQWVDLSNGNGDENGQK